MNDSRRARNAQPSRFPQLPQLQSKSGILQVLATPIGNLGDLSPRARAALESADTIYCEDTRQGAKLLSALGIAGGSRLKRLDAHAALQTLEDCVSAIVEGEHAVLITDAGTPGVSDPGAALVALAHESAVRVTPIPGPSAATALLSIAGFRGATFTFYGFFPRKSSEIKEVLNEASRRGVGVWFESPQRIVETSACAALIFPDALGFVAKELTKIHERSFRGRLADLAVWVREEVTREGERGEWCFAIEFQTLRSEAKLDASPISEETLKALQCLLDAKIPASEAAKRISQVFGVKKNKVYEAALELSGKISGKKSAGGD